MPTKLNVVALILVAGGLAAACAGPAADAPGLRDRAAAGARSPASWPATLRVVGDGYPSPGDPCRSLGETELVMEYLDHTERLVGCPTRADADRIGASYILTEDGITVGSVTSLGP